MRTPFWLKRKLSFDKEVTVKKYLRQLKLHTICEEANCPNMSECFSKKIATFLILGNICTRNCAFCGVKKGRPSLVDVGEPERIAEAVRRLGLEYVVITSVSRDDLKDAGACQFVRTIRAVKLLNPGVAVEVLIPDFYADTKLLKMVVKERPAVINHNIETVKRLYPLVRSKSNYERSLEVLRIVKGLDESILTKSGIMLGLGEDNCEVINALMDLRRVRCDFLTIGQYLPPSRAHFPVKKYISPDDFLSLKSKGKSLGFKHVESSPYARSSYHASDCMKSMVTSDS